MSRNHLYLSQDLVTVVLTMKIPLNLPFQRETFIHFLKTGSRFLTNML